jgi:hypothetical protein
MKRPLVFFLGMASHAVYFALFVYAIGFTGDLGPALADNPGLPGLFTLKEGASA